MGKKICRGKFFKRRKNTNMGMIILMTIRMVIHTIILTDTGTMTP